MLEAKFRFWSHAKSRARTCIEQGCSIRSRIEMLSRVEISNARFSDFECKGQGWN